jgi:uncharacterized membrane protein (Fun14 family)
MIGFIGGLGDGGIIGFMVGSLENWSRIVQRTV